MDMDADPEGALQIFLYYMQVRENSYMSIESGLATVSYTHLDSLKKSGTSRDSCRVHLLRGAVPDC